MYLQLNPKHKWDNAENFQKTMAQGGNSKESQRLASRVLDSSLPGPWISGVFEKRNWDPNMRASHSVA